MENEKHLVELSDEDLMLIGAALAPMITASEVGLKDAVDISSSEGLVDRLSKFESFKNTVEIFSQNFLENEEFVNLVESLSKELNNER